MKVRNFRYIEPNHCLCCRYFKHDFKTNQNECRRYYTVNIGSSPDEYICDEFDIN